MIIFFGTSSRSARFLELAIQNGLKVDLVVSEPPKPIDKKQILTENPTVSVAKKSNILFLTSIFQLQDPRLQTPEASATGEQAASNFLLPSSTATIGLILDFNKIIPNEIINLFSKGILNIHFSKLPQSRGPAPVQYTILNGDSQAWITYYLISEKLDAGKIITQTSLPLDLTENTETLYQKLIEKSAGEIGEILNSYTNGALVPQPQSGTPSNTHKLTTENCKIDWTKTDLEIERFIRAAYPEPGAWTEVALNNKVHRFKILKAHLENGKLVFDLVQLEGKNPVSWKQFTQGYPTLKFLSPLSPF